MQFGIDAALSLKFQAARACVRTRLGLMPLIQRRRISASVPSSNRGAPLFTVLGYLGDLTVVLYPSFLYPDRWYLHYITVGPHLSKAGNTD